VRPQQLCYFRRSEEDRLTAAQKDFASDRPVLMRSNDQIRNVCSDTHRFALLRGAAAFVVFAPI
jgi:hypothetical protein